MDSAQWNDVEVGQEFIDRSKKGKDRCWKQRKLNNARLGYDLMELQYNNPAERVLDCSEQLEFNVQNDGSLKLGKVWFCKNKLCPICNWRRALKHSHQASRVLNQAMFDYSTAQFLFLTLTVKNVLGKDLNKALSELTKSFDRLFRRAKIKKNLIGFMRATEVTYNEKRHDYHPHLHILMMVKTSYFKGSSNYISQQEWSQMWQQSAKLNYVPMVDVRKVKSSNDNDIYKAVLETAKYPVKPIDSMDLKDTIRLRVVDDLYKGLYRKRQIAYGGELKKIYKKLALDDLENGDLVHVADDSSDGVVVNKVVAKWFWDLKAYYRIE